MLRIGISSNKISDNLGMTNLDVFSDFRLTFHLISPCRDIVVASVENLFSQIVLIFQYLPLNIILLVAFIVQSRKIKNRCTDNSHKSTKEHLPECSPQDTASTRHSRQGDVFLRSNTLRVQPAGLP